MSSTGDFQTTPPKGPRMKLKVKRKEIPTGTNGPQLLTFPQGLPASLGKPSTSLTGRLLAGAEQRKLAQRELIIETPKVSYKGVNYGSDSTAHNSCKYAIGVYNPAKKRLRLMETNHIFTMRQSVAAIEALDKGTDSALTPLTESEKWSMQQRMLVESFGAAKAQRVMKSKLNNRVDLENKETVSSVDKALGSQYEQLVPDDSTQHQIKEAILPPFNADTKEVHEIYDVLQMTGEAAWDSLDYKFFQRVAKSPELGDGQFPFILDRCRYAGSVNMDRDQRIGMFKTVQFLAHLMRFYQAPGGKKAKELERMKASDAVRERIAELFMEKDSFTKRNAAKLMCYICVLSLILCDFALNEEAYTLLAKDLGVTIQDLKHIYREVGCTVTKEKVTLKAPLSLPKLRLARDKSKKR